MSGINIINALLTADAAVTALVPATRIGAGVLPARTTLPAIGLAIISKVDRNIASPAAKVVVTERIQVTVMANDYPAKQALLAAVRKACRDQHGTIATFAGVAVLTDGAGPDFQSEGGSGIYLQSQDFKVTYSETP